MKRTCMLVVVVVMALLAVGTATKSEQQLGGYTPIKDPNNPEVVDIAKFAISKHNEEAKSNLHYLRIVKGEQQLVSAAINYRLVISATALDADADAGHSYQALVYDAPSKHIRNLVSFKPL